MEFDREHVARRLSQHLGTSLPEEDLTGAVLVPFTADQTPTLLFTRRAPAVANFPGEVSFPGGKREPGDTTLLETALRETEEEIGVPASQLDVVGRLDDRHVYGRHRIRSYVGFLHAAARPRPEPREVERIFRVPLGRFLDASVYEARRWRDPPDDAPERVVHYFRLDDEIIWGATGRLVTQLLEITAGWRPPAEPRVVDSWDAFRKDL